MQFYLQTVDVSPNIQKTEPVVDRWDSPSYWSLDLLTTSPGLDLDRDVVDGRIVRFRVTVANGRAVYRVTDQVDDLVEAVLVSSYWSLPRQPLPPPHLTDLRPPKVEPGVG